MTRKIFDLVEYRGRRKGNKQPMTGIDWTDLEDWQDLLFETEQNETEEEMQTVQPKKRKGEAKKGKEGAKRKRHTNKQLGPLQLGPLDTIVELILPMDEESRTKMLTEERMRRNEARHRQEELQKKQRLQQLQQRKQSLEHAIAQSERLGNPLQNLSWMERDLLAVKEEIENGDCTPEPPQIPTPL